MNKVERGFRWLREINTVYYDPELITVQEMEKVLKKAGTYAGTADPRQLQLLFREQQVKNPGQKGAAQGLRHRAQGKNNKKAGSWTDPNKGSGLRCCIERPFLFGTRGVFWLYLIAPVKTQSLFFLAL